MTPQDFRRWQKHLNLSNREAAEALGVSASMVATYATGHHRGEKRRDQEVKIRKPIRLACAALAMGIKDYDGPE